MDKKLTFGAIASSLAVAIAATSAHANETAKKADAKAAGSGYCENNQCKGHSECKGHGNDACKGKTSCKGHGWLKASSKDECEKDGKGKWMASAK